MRRLLIVPSPILRQKCEPMVDSYQELRSLVQDMADYMYDHRNGEIAPIGLAAPQLGESVRVMVFYLNSEFRERDGIQELINPTILRTKKLIKRTETCLSIPGKVFSLKRYDIVKIQGFTLDGRSRTFRSRGLLAQVFQHEVNHLDGVLIDEIGELV